MNNLLLHTIYNCILFGTEIVPWLTASAGFWGIETVCIFSGLQGVELSGRVIFYADCLLVPPTPMASAAHASWAERATAPAGISDLSVPALLAGTDHARYYVWWCGSTRALHVAPCLPLPLPAWMPGAQEESSFQLPAWQREPWGRLVFAFTYVLATIQPSGREIYCAVKIHIRS